MHNLCVRFAEAACRAANDFRSVAPLDNDVWIPDAPKLRRAVERGTDAIGHASADEERGT